ncbi:MAG: hypothetical protein U1E33_06285 [Rhodospirillales bacterium]
MRWRPRASLHEVRDALSRANSNSPLGTLDGLSQSFILDAWLARAELYKPLIVAWRNGALVRLADVASTRTRSRTTR